ncbi:hypothetical protein D3C85_1937080 [compost metagenome]
MVTATAGPPTVIGVPLMAVTRASLFSKMLKASRSIIFGTSSLVVSEDATMSATGLMVMLTALVALE